MLFCIIYAILYKKLIAELGQTFRGAFRPSLIGRIFFRMSASKSGGCILSLKYSRQIKTATVKLI